MQIDPKIFLILCFVTLFDYNIHIHTTGTMIIIDTEQIEHNVMMLCLDLGE